MLAQVDLLKVPRGDYIGEYFWQWWLIFACRGIDQGDVAIAFVRLRQARQGMLHVVANARQLA